ncbi:MAG: DUF6165 family protein [Bacteroidales bacterium]
MKIEVSNGEIVDKLTIIEIKLSEITDKAKLTNLRKEYVVLDKAVATIISKDNELYKELLKINKELWDVEDRLRDMERRKDFGEAFVKNARAVYYTNDKRSEVKRKINEITNSDLVEEKSYEKYN